MPFLHRRDSLPAILLVVLLTAAAPARALFTVGGSSNQVFLFGGATYSYDSNLYSEHDGQGDYAITTQVGAELKRHAGIISVDSTLKFDYIRYGKVSEENTLNPNFGLDLTKIAGRTTGALKLAAYRETRADSAVNLRTSSWIIPVSLNLKYPLNEKFYATSETAYLRRSYSAGQGLVDNTDFSEAVDLNYVYTSKLDLFAGYRLRSGRTSLARRSLDQRFNLGATGRLLAKLTGTVRLGYQLRHVRATDGGRFHQINALAGLSWPITQKLALNLQASRDFDTIATGASVDTTSLRLGSNLTLTRKVSFTGAVSTGRNRFLNASQGNRRDNFMGGELGVRYAMNDHLQAGASYDYLKNSSSLLLADFDSHGFSLDISLRY